MIPGSSFKQRRDRLAKKLKEERLDGFLATTTEGIYYLTGATFVPEERPFFILIRPSAEPVLVVPKLELAHMEKAGIGTVVAYGEFPAPEGEMWTDVLDSCLNGIGRLGVEPEISAERLAGISRVDTVVSSVLEEMRKIKTPEEVGMIKNTASWADQGMGEILKASYSGATVAEIFSRSKSLQARVIRETDYDPMASSFLTASWPAPFSSQPHGIPEINDRMGKGPLVAISYLRVNGYAAEVERTYFHHKPSPTEKDIFQAMMAARALALSMICPGAACHDIDRAVCEFLTGQGYGEYLLHRTGHGIGLGNHEGPWVARGCRDVLAENMVISIEPGIYIPDIGGFRHSDTCLVTDRGHTRLTRHPDSLDALTLTGKKPLRRVLGRLMRWHLGMH